MIPTMGGAVLAVAVILSPGANTDAALASASEPTAKPSVRTTHGIASYVRASLGPRYLASRLPKGTHLRVCGPVGCISGHVTDYGPSKRIHSDRIVDLSASWFQVVCGPLWSGVCWVTVSR